MNGLEALANLDQRQFFRLFVDGRFQRKYGGWLGYEAGEPGSVKGMLNGFQYSIENLEEAGRLTGHHIERLHHACLHNVFAKNPKSIPGEIRVHPGGFPLFRKTTTLESIEEILLMRTGDGTITFNTREFSKRAEDLDATTVFKRLQEKGRLSFKPWHPPVEGKVLAALKRHHKYSDFYEAKHRIRSAYASRIEMLLDEFNSDISAASTKKNKLSRICRLIRDLELLHPFQDGNGRTFASALLNQLLIYHDFLPAMLLNPNLDAEMSYAQWESQVLQGIENTRLILEDPDTPLFKLSVNDIDDRDHAKFIEMSAGLANAIKQKIKEQGDAATSDAKTAQASRLRLKGAEIVRPLGKGTNASIYLIKKTGDSTSLLVLKHIPKIKNLDMYKNEIAAYRALRDYSKGVKLISHKRADSEAMVLFKHQRSEGIRAYLKREGQVTDQQIFEMVIDVLDTIDFMADRGILHLDIMASNVLYNGDRFFLNDWGDCQAGPEADTFSDRFNKLYMPPELYLGKRDVASEIYSLGCVVYYVASRRNIDDMFGLAGCNRAQKIFAHVYREPRFNQNISPIIQRLIGHMVQKRPQDRPDISQLRSWIHKENIPEPPTGGPCLTGKGPTAPLEVYRRMADDNIPYGHFKLGTFFKNGYHVEKNRAEAINHFEHACQSGFVPAMHSLAKLLGNSDQHAAAELSKQVKLAKQRAKID